MNTEWKELNGIGDVARALADGMEIQVAIHQFDSAVKWAEWNQQFWDIDRLYRARPRKPETVKVKSLCWRGKGTGHLVWWDALANPGKGFVRFPAGDFSGEVEV